VHQMRAGSMTAAMRVLLECSTRTRARHTFFTEFFRTGAVRPTSRNGGAATVLEDVPSGHRRCPDGSTAGLGGTKLRLGGGLVGLAGAERRRVAKDEHVLHRLHLVRLARDDGDEVVTGPQRHRR